MAELDRWTRVRLLGEGGYGQVHLAWDTVERRWVAVKRFTGRTDLDLLRAVIESRIRVAHPHLVRTLGFRLVDDQAWLITELARGGSVKQLMHRIGPLPVGWVVQLVGQVLDALGALHADGVVHRDVKPANLLLRDAGRAGPHALVGDFGIASWRAVSVTGAGAAVGTPGYLAPEYLDAGKPTPGTDLFSVGVVAAELLSGRRLIHRSNASVEVPANWDPALPLPAEVPTGVGNVLRRMADPDPARRYASCDEARQALRDATPPAVQGGLGDVLVPDLLDELPAGWSVTGPADGAVQATIADLAPVEPPAGPQSSPTPADTRPIRPEPRPPVPGLGTPALGRRRHRLIAAVCLLVAAAVVVTVLVATRATGPGTPAASSPSSPTASSVAGSPTGPASRVPFDGRRLNNGDLVRLDTLDGAELARPVDGRLRTFRTQLTVTGVGLSDVVDAGAGQAYGAGELGTLLLFSLRVETLGEDLSAVVAASVSVDGARRELPGFDRAVSGPGGTLHYAVAIPDNRPAVELALDHPALVQTFDLIDHRRTGRQPVVLYRFKAKYSWFETNLGTSQVRINRGRPAGRRLGYGIRVQSANLNYFVNAKAAAPAGARSWLAPAADRAWLSVVFEHRVHRSAGSHVEHCTVPPSAFTMTDRTGARHRPVDRFATASPGNTRVVFDVPAGFDSGTLTAAPGTLSCVNTTIGAERWSASGAADIEIAVPAR